MSVTGPFSEAGVFWATDPWINFGSGYTGMVPNSTGAAANNTAVLQYLIYLAQSSNTTSGACSNPVTNPPWAATIVIPGHTSVPPPVGSGGPPTDAGAVYYLATPTSPPIPNAAINVGCPYPIRILGTGNVQLSMVDNGTMFYVNTKAGDDSNIGGLTFEDLHLRYSNSESGAGIAIHVAASTGSGANDGAQNVRIFRCVFTDCLIGAWFEQALQCSMLQCTIDIVSFSGTGVQVGGPNNGFEKPFGKDIFITDCIFEVASGAPSGNVGLNLIAAEHVRGVNKL